MTVVRWGKIFLLTQTIRSPRFSKWLVCNEVPVLGGVKFFDNTNNPHPEALEGSLCAKEATALRQAQGPCFDRPLDATLRVQGAYVTLN